MGDYTRQLSQLQALLIKSRVSRLDLININSRACFEVQAPPSIDTVLPALPPTPRKSAVN